MNLHVLLICFAAGLLSDVLVTAYYICVGRQLAFPAASISVPIAMLNFWVIDRVLIRMTSWSAALAFAMGNAVGCLLIMQAIKRFGGKRWRREGQGLNTSAR